MTEGDLCDPEGLALHAGQKRFEGARAILDLTQMGFPERG
jgi:hypothetical protein